MPTKLDLFLNGDPNSTSDTKKKGFKAFENGSKFNLQNYSDFKEKYYLATQEDWDQFYRLYYADIENGTPRYFTEKHTSVGQLRVDLDIKFDGVVDEHKHTPDQVAAFVKVYMAEVKKYVETTDPIEIYVLEKDYPTFDKVKNISASGIHIQIPAIKTRAGVEQAIRRTLLTNKGAAMEACFPGLGFRGTWEDVYDKQPLTHTNMWMVLGSKKNNEGLPYKIRYTLKSSGDEVTVDQTRGFGMNIDLMKKLSVRSFENEETPMTEFGKANVHIQPEREVIPISGGRATAPGRGRQAQRGPVVESRDSSPGRVYIAPLTESMRAYYEAHVRNLAPSRYTNYKDWTDVGICLKNIHPDLLEVWLDFSAQVGDSYKQGECISKWNGFGFRTDGLTVKSLRYWSREDNLEGFNRAENQNVDRLIESAAKTCAENDVAQVIYARYGDEFKCARYGTNVWYQFVGHVWRETDKGIQLQLRLSQDIAKLFLEKEETQMAIIRNNGDCGHGREFNPECDTCRAEKDKDAYSKMRIKLKTPGYKRGVMDECRELFLDETLANKLDENKNLIAFNNGVLDTATMVFREGKPEDYVSFSTKLNYDPEKHYSAHECWPEVEKFLRDILPDKDVRDYFLRHMSTCLNGGNEAQKFHILTGSGSNGKSMFNNLMSTCMGDYTCKAPISLLTQSRNKSAAAAPELVRMKGRRFVTMQEPDEEVPLNTGLMKELASCEKITCRDLYQGSKQMIDFDIQARFHLACNEKPKINATDGGTWRRLCVIDFPSKFVHNPTAPHEKPIDESLVQKVVSVEWAECFLSYLVDIYRVGNGWRRLTPPTKVMAYTNEYQEDSDVVARFLREFVRAWTPEDVDKNDGIVPTKKTVMTEFMTWKRENSLLHRPGASPQELEKRLTTLYGPPTNWNIAFRFGVEG